MEEFAISQSSDEEIELFDTIKDSNFENAIHFTLEKELDNLMKEVENLSFQEETTILQSLMSNLENEPNLQEKKEMIENNLLILEEDIKELSKNELSQICQDLGIASTGSISTLQKRILECKRKELE